MAAVISERADPRLVRRCAAFATASSVFAVVAGLAVLAGWNLHIVSLLTWGATTPMAPSSAAASVLGGLSLWLLRTPDDSHFSTARKLTAKAASVSTGLIGALCLAEFLLRLDFGSDRLLLATTPTLATAGLPQRMSPISGAMFVLLSLALLTIDKRTLRLDWPAQFLALAAIMWAAFGSIDILIVPGASRIALALPTALIGLCLPIGIVCARAPWAIGGMLTSDTRGARLLRKTVPASLFVLSLVGLSLSKPLLTDTHIGAAAATVLALFCSVLLAGFIVWVASIVDHDEIERRKIEEAQQLSSEQLNRLLNRIEEPAEEPQLRRKVTLALIFAILLTGLLGLLSWLDVQQATETAAGVARTQEVMTVLERTLRHSVDIETGGRGFAETGSAQFLEPYASGRPAAVQDLQALRRLLLNPDQLQRLHVLEKQISEQVEEVVVIVATRQHEGTIPTVAQFERGKHGMDAVRTTVEQMEAAERGLLMLRAQRARAAQHSSSVVIMLGSLLGVMFLTVAGVTVSREIGVSTRARGQVKALNDELEQRVEQRTAALQSEVEVHKRTEEKRERLAAVVEFSDDAILTKNLDGTISAWNRGAEKVFGYSAAEMVGKQMHMLMPRERAGEELGILARIKSGESVEHFETVRVRKDGTMIDVSVTISPIRDCNGTIVGASKVARDITGRKQAEEALREKERRLSESQRIAHIGSWAYDLNDLAARFVWSDELYRLYGVSLETFVPTMETLLSLIVAEDRSLMRNWMTACAAGEKPTDMDFRIRLPDGTVRVFSRRGELQCDSDNQPIRMAGTTQDVTERRQAEVALKETEEQLLAMANGIPQLAWIAGPDGSIFWYNQRWYEFTGTSLAQMQGWGWQSVHHPDYLPEVLARWTNAIAEGKPFEMEFPLRGANGLFHAFLTRVMPLKDSAGRVVRWFGTNTDISGLKQTLERLAVQAEELSRHRAELLSSQAALQTQTSLLTLVLESIGEGLVAADREGHFLLWNGSASKLLSRGASNLPPEEWSSHYACYLPDGITPCPTQELPLVRALNGESLEAELIIRQAEKQDTVVEFSGRPMRDAEGNLCGGVVAFRDITRRKIDELEIHKLNEDLEERIAKRTEQLASANRELEAFSYSVSHDLRTPLRHIAGFSKILVNNFGPVMGLEAREYLQLIEDAVRRMDLLVESLLGLAKLGQQSLKLRVTELNPIVEEVVSMLRPECEGRDVEWRIAKLPALDCDPILMVQVFQNLLGNAMKYSRGRAKSVIEVDSIQQSGKPAIIFVRDNGAGFDLRYAEKLFGVFQRFHTASEFEGTGVGLATVHRIIRRHGGTIWAESEPDQGTTFYFALQTTEQIRTTPKATAAS